MFVFWLAWSLDQPPQNNDDGTCNQHEIMGLARSTTSIDMFYPCVSDTIIEGEHPVIPPGSSSSGNIRP
jgi:hypothetical protein